MGISETCIRCRPVMTTSLLMAAFFVIFGAFSYRLLARRGAAACRFS